MFDTDFWYAKKQKKFLHNIDTLYFSVKLHDDLTSDGDAANVQQFRRVITRYAGVSTGEVFKELQYKEKVLYSKESYPPYYSFHVYVPEKYDIFVAPVVPSGAETVASVTSEIVVQIRARLLWELGAKLAFDSAFDFVQAFCAAFDLTIAEVKENRVDFCWHTNALQDPEQYLRIDNLAKMQVSRFKRVTQGYQLLTDDGYESDYHALGKRGDKCFLRMYLKTKEVVEMGYKGFFFYVWLFNGLISRYDLYVLEEAYKKKNWKFVDVARLQFALEYLDLGIRKEEIRALVETEPYNYPAIKKAADEFTPQLTKILNIEYQVMRRMTKSFKLIELKDNEGVCKRIYDFLDNRRMITNYLTHDTFRLVDRNTDSNKSRCDYTDFWKRLRATKQVDVLNRKDLKLVRDYTSKLNMEIRKQKAVRAVGSFALTLTRKPDATIYEDAAELLSVLNDNDIHDLHKYKHKRMRQLPDPEDDEQEIIDLEKYRDITILNEDGEILGDDQ